MEAASPEGPREPQDSPEVILRARPWLQKFKAWKTLIKNGCPAGVGQRGGLCSWIGFNCSFNNCPRRNFEEDELIMESVLKVEKQERTIQSLRTQLKQKNIQVTELKKQISEQ